MLKDFLEITLLEFGNYRLTVAMPAGVLLIYIATRLLLRALHRVLHHRNLFSKVDAGRKHSLYLILTYFFWTLAALFMLQAMGVHLTVLLAGSAALLVGFGLGVQDIFRDIVSGIFLLFEGSIEIGDVLQVDDQMGRVEQIGLRTSRIYTRDGVYLKM